MDDDDKIRFHNGDTLDSIPVIRDVPQRRSIPWRTVAGVVGTAVLVGTIVGISVGMGERNRPQAATPDAPLPVTTAPVAAPSPVVPTATMTETVTATPTDPQPQPPVQQAPYVPDYTDAAMEEVVIVNTPDTGGDPSTNYCLAYLEQGATLLANAPGYMCHDFLFSTHPSLEQSVFEEVPPAECGDTPGGRLAILVFDPVSSWGGDPLYTCLLMNDGA